MKTLIAAVVALPLMACSSTQYYADLARATGNVINNPKADQFVEKNAAKIAEFCTEIKLGLLALDMYSFEDQRIVTSIKVSKDVVADFCNKPPKNLSDALVILANTAAIIVEIRKETKV